MKITFIHGPQGSGKSRLGLQLFTELSQAVLYDPYVGPGVPRPPAGTRHLIVVSQNEPTPLQLTRANQVVRLESSCK